MGWWSPTARRSRRHERTATKAWRSAHRPRVARVENGAPAAAALHVLDIVRRGRPGRDRLLCGERHGLGARAVAIAARWRRVTHEWRSVYAEAATGARFRAPARDSGGSIHQLRLDGARAAVAGDPARADSRR